MEGCITNIDEKPQMVRNDGNDDFAIMALENLHREYPNIILHLMTDDGDARSPRNLTPAFFGSFDWHSAVHAHWLLVRVLRTNPQTTLKEEIIAAISKSLTVENIRGELTYRTGREAFERPYGIAWLLQLVAELDEGDDLPFGKWRATLRPLEENTVDSMKSWLPRLAYPVRSGVHSQTAFSFGLMLDYARAVGDKNLTDILIRKSLDFFADDKDGPLTYEPSGVDFLSPCLAEADLMRRVFPQDVFGDWLSDFLPSIPTDDDTDWLEPGIVLDKSDGQLVHLDGLNLSRAWMLEGIAAALPETDERRQVLQETAARHSQKGLAAISEAQYAGSHWLGTFGVYLTTKRRIGQSVFSYETA